MNIALFGYGRMGKAIEGIAQQHGHTIVQRITAANATETPAENADVVIEFSTPTSATQNILSGIYAGKPVVVGTTGWLDELPEIELAVQNANGALLHASNFSIGVNIFFEVNRRLAELMNDRPEYTATIEETHHIHKLDAPSGTAISLANDLVSKLDRLSGWSPEGNDENIKVHSIRKDEVPGTHKVKFSSSIDDITIEHKAHSREGFALGAVLAAEWLKSRKGCFTMKDLLNI